MVKKKGTTRKKATTKKIVNKKAPAQMPTVLVRGIKLDPDETKAFKLAHSSDNLRKDLDYAVFRGIAQAVRKAFKQHEVALTPPQAATVANALFGACRVSR
jgi:hypothetical protein